MKLYEGMFIVDSSAAERDWAGVVGELEGIIKRHGGEVVDLRKWDDRRLAYEINRIRRGMYVLVHFNAPPLAMQEMRRDFNLSEKIVRQLVTIDEDGVPKGEERPGITSTAIADFGDRDEREGGDRGDRRGPRRFRERGEEAVPEGIGTEGEGVA